MARLKIDGVEMPPIQSLDIEKERIWSSKTGRTANGTMKGDIVAYKDKLNIVFAPMSDADSKILENAIHPAFFSVTFRDPRTGKDKTSKFYTGTPKYPVYSYANGLPRYVGTAVNLIEQ